MSMPDRRPHSFEHFTSTVLGSNGPLILPLRLRHRVFSYNPKTHIQSRPISHLAIKPISTLPTDTHTGFTKQISFYRLIVRYISAYRFHLLITFFLPSQTAAARKHQTTGFSGLSCFFVIMSMYALLSLAGPGLETMYVGVGVGGWDWDWERGEKPNVLCTICLFSSGIGLKEAVSAMGWERGGRGWGRGNG